MIKAFANFIIIKTDVLFNEKTKFKGVGGRDIVFDSSFDPQRHARIYGEVVSLPLHMTRIPIAQEHKGLPSYDGESPYHYRYVSDITPEVKIGDRIYFHFNVIRQHNFVHVDGVHPDRTWYVKARYDQVICAVRDGQIIMIGGHTLIDPDFESWEDISIPIPQMGFDGKPMTNKDGSPIMKPKDQWLVRKAFPTYKYLTGFVKKVGTPLKGDTCQIKEGQKILYRRNADWMVKIEDRDYFVIKQRHIEGRWEEEENA